MGNLIELDEYLDLSKLDLVNQEFIDTVDEVSSEYVDIFTANLVKEHDLTYSDGVDILYLRDSLPDFYEDYCYEQIDKSIFWKDYPVYDYFPQLRKLISLLPFESIGRIFVVYNKDKIDTHTHFDHTHDCHNEFIWLRLNKNKKMFILEDGKKFFHEGYSCWFDSRKFHGAEALGRNGVSVRVDGKFTSDFREKVFGKDAEWESLPLEK